MPKHREPRAARRAPAPEVERHQVLTSCHELDAVDAGELHVPARLIITTDDPSGIEAYWHERFAARHTKGEGFALTRDDIRAFKRQRFM